MIETSDKQGRVVLWVFAGTVVFFLLAATSVPSTEKPQRGRRKNATRATEMRQHYEATREAVFQVVYRKTFLKLHQEHVQFLTPRQAKAMLPGTPDSIRNVRCGGWVSTVPRLMLRFMGRRCPPMELA